MMSMSGEFEKAYCDEHEYLAYLAVWSRNILMPANGNMRKLLKEMIYA